MKIFSKKNLKLQETVYKKKDVVLKEYDINDNMGYNNINGIANSLTNNGKANVVSNPDKNVINATVLSKDNNVTPQEVQSQIGDTIKTAQKTNSDVNVTGIKIPSNAQQINNSNSNTVTSNLSEQVIMTKKRMNKFLQNI